MTIDNKLHAAVCHFLIWFMMLNIRSGYGTVSDVYCLKTFKDSVGDPLGYLSSWNFGSVSEGSICKFAGVDCWHDDENKVLNIKLAGFGLTGHFPSGLENCSSLTGLDLSSNNFSGFLPHQISHILEFVTALDLSWNQFSGEIPESLSNCTYLTTLRLNDNQLSGRIPNELGKLFRLREFSVANNYLQGQVPEFIYANVTEYSYSSNPGLCGAPLLKACKRQPGRGSTIKINAGIKSGFVVGAAVGFIASIFIVIVAGERILTLFRC